MLKGLEYETVFAKMTRAFVAAVMVVLGIILLMGIQLASCNLSVLIIGVAAVTILFMIGSSI